MNPPHRIELMVGETYSLELPGLGTAGYRWQHEPDETAGIIDITWQRGRPASEPAAPAGASAPDVATLHATRAGLATVRLVQRRSWEGDRPPLRSHELEVIVQPRAEDRSG